MMMKRSPLRRFIFYCVYFFAFILLFFVAGEITTRILGFKSYHPEVRVTKVEGDKEFFVRDNELGFKSQEGYFKIEVDNTHSFYVNNEYSGFRVDNPYYSTPYVTLPETWLFGCSLIHGWMLGDYNTIPFILKEKFPLKAFKNYGMSGYSTLQSLKVLQGQLASINYRTRYKPIIIILAYASFHDQRNSASRFWMRAISTQSIVDSFSIPFARFGENDSLVYGVRTIDYNPWPLVRSSSFMHFLETRYDHYDEKKLRSHEVTLKLIDRFISICENNKIKFILAGIDDDEITKQTLDYYSKQGVATVDVSSDLDDPDLTFLPFDPHPNAKGDSIMAEKLAAYLSSLPEINSNSEVD